MDKDCNIIEANDENIIKAADILNSGGLVSFPTETVYGLGANAANDSAVAKIYATKRRPQINPLIIHVPSIDMALAIGEFSEDALKLAEKFWPGPLTLVVNLKSSAKISKLCTAGLDTIAIRIPNHHVALKLLQSCNLPLAAPSANQSGKLSPTEASHVEKSLIGHGVTILDGGVCELGIESTILGFIGGKENGDTKPKAQLLRYGSLKLSEIEKVLGYKIIDNTNPQKTSDTNKSQPSMSSPGQLLAHYAPNARLILNASSFEKGDFVLGFGKDAPKFARGFNLSLEGDLQEACANLFSYLHMLDDIGVEIIKVMPIPDEGLGIAINDRLRRAAAR